MAAANKLKSNSKSSVQYYIDTCEFGFKSERNTFNIPDATTAQVISKHGEVLDRYQNRINIIGKHHSHGLHVRTMNSGEKILVEGSPFAYKYGQNTYTSSNMKKAAFIALSSAFKAIGFEPTAEQKKVLKAGDIDILRVDIAVNIRLQSRAEVVETLTQVRRQLIEQRGNTETCDTTVYWAPASSKEYSIGLYAKGPQLSRSKRYNQLPEKDKYMDDCESILRIEVRLRPSALRKLGLSKVSDWTNDSARIAFCRYMTRLKLLNITSGPVTAEEIEALPSRLRPIFALHKAGCNLKALCSPRTLQRHLSDFRKLGIDLKIPNQVASSVVSLTKLLSPKNAIKATPVWMVHAGVAPPSINLASKPSDIGSLV